MELRHLEYFVAVAEELSFTRAARRLHVVQSGVSAAISALEKELGSPLFDRSAKQVALTGAGAALLPEAHATLDAAAAARDAVRGRQDSLHGRIDVGAMMGVSLLDLPALLGRFHAEHPAVSVRLRVSPRGSAGLAQSLVTGDLDVAFLSLAGRTPGGLTARELAAVPMVLLTPANHRLARRKQITLSELADEEFIDFPPGYANRDLMDRAFAISGIGRRVTLEVTDISLAAAYVRHGLGIAFLPEFSAPYTDDLSVLTVSDHALFWSLAVATSSTRRPSAALRALLGLVDRFVSGSGAAVPASGVHPGQAEVDPSLTIGETR